MTGQLTPAEMARTTAMLSHIGGLLDGLPLDAYLETLREQRKALPFPWENVRTPVEDSMSRRIRALIAAATKGLEIVDEVHTAAAFWRAMQVQQQEAELPGTPDTGPTVVQPGGQVLRPKFGALANTTSCDCAMGECSHAVGFDGPA